MKKNLSLLLAAVLLCGLLAACNQNDASSSLAAPSSSLPASTESTPPPDIEPAPSYSAPALPDAPANNAVPADSASSSPVNIPEGSGIVPPTQVIDYEWRVVPTADVNLRKGPGTEYDSQLVIPKGTDLYEIGSMDGDYHWIYLGYEGTQGWVSADWLSFPDGGIAKPVIYLYPEKTTDVQVKVRFENGGFTCTYPDYAAGWAVTARPDGTLTNKADGLEYSYLYWEGESQIDFDMSKGFVVKGDDTAAFLREKLAYLGLTAREYNEFIVYWLPLMHENPYNLITFQTDCYTNNVQLEVNPKPDSMLRVYMVYAPLEAPIDLPEQTLTPFEREGFAVVEWGGGQWAGAELG